MEGSVRPSVDQELVSEGGSVAGAGNVDIVHVSSWDLLANLGNQVQDKLDIISLTLLSIHIPKNVTILSVNKVRQTLPASLVAIGSHNDGVITNEVGKRLGVPLAAIT